MIEIEAELSGRRLNPGDALEFRCHPGVACFNSCCRDKRLSLLPYDVVRLARALGRPTGEFLAQHAVLEIEPGSGWPTLRLELAPDGRCPFVGEGGCGVYRDRPTCCRIFPLARAVRLDSCGAAVESFAVDASCPGFGERGPARSPTVAEWTREQGLDPYRAANDRVARLFLHPHRRRPLSLATDDVHAVVMALYNVDVFRVFAARPGFGNGTASTMRRWRGRSRPTTRSCHSGRTGSLAGSSDDTAGATVKPRGPRVTRMWRRPLLHSRLRPPLRAPSGTGSGRARS